MKWILCARCLLILHIAYSKMLYYVPGYNIMLAKMASVFVFIYFHGGEYASFKTIKSPYMILSTNTIFPMLLFCQTAAI